ncbi:hypothetical protein J437_LFUL017389 [Ladona fulva]|uniref:PiggyBac transposable element-derived protein domain-containing protein n=1 Tax=Ladona fulva TaxID=123851 RepID=A0A8K0PCG7_LADFU|nr:hypothetical protein J437_LFUL017389 [Ladona fulva]
MTQQSYHLFDGRMGDSDVSMFSSDESDDSYNPSECDQESDSSSSQEGSMDESSFEESNNDDQTTKTDRLTKEKLKKKGKRVGHGHEVVLQLTAGLLNEGRTLYIDNFYTSVGLAEELLENKTYVCGTLRSNRRGNPSENRNSVRVMKWQDKRPMLMISSNPELAENVVPSTSKNKKVEILMKPKSVLTYNKTKKGVDVSDQMSSYYKCIRRTLKWYKKLAIELFLGSCMGNI